MFAQTKSGLSASIVNALTRQLDAKAEILSRASGTVVSVSHTAFSKVQQSALARAGYQSPINHFAPITVSQIAIVSIVNKITANTSPIASNSPSSSR
jgi:hypothetical protein